MMKKHTKNLFRIYLICLIFVIGSFNFASNVNAQTKAEGDPKNDQWNISVLNFFYVVGAEFGDGDPPNSESEFKNVVSNMVGMSTETNSPNGMDIKEIGVYIEDPDYNAIYVEFYGDPRDIDQMYIYGFGDHDGERISFTMDLEDGFGNCTYTTDVVGETNETIALSDDELSTFFFPKEYFDWEEGDTLLVIVLTFTGSESNPLSSIITYDFCPNDDLYEDPYEYQGNDPIVSVIDSVAHFLFGDVMTGRIPFIFLMVIAIVLGQILLDRKNKYAHWIGFGLLGLLLYPIIVYSLSVPYTNGVLGLDYLALLDIIILLVFAGFIVMALFNSFNLLKRYRFMFIIGMALLTFQATITMIMYPTAEVKPLVQLIILGACNIALPIILRESKRVGRANEK